MKTALRAVKRITEREPIKNIHLQILSRNTTTIQAGGIFVGRDNEEAEMRTLIKTLSVTDGQMNMIKAGRRSSFAQFSGHIKVFETLDKENILGHAVKRTKKISASLICIDMDYSTDEEINSGNVYEATATVQGEHEREKLLFAGLRFDDSDPVAGSITFEITDLELIRKLLTM